MEQLECDNKHWNVSFCTVLLMQVDVKSYYLTMPNWLLSLKFYKFSCVTMLLICHATVVVQLFL